ncbi:geranylgeranyl reductase family protein [Kribbella sp. VKM Ac-2569]|uniref:NAD(P)/FAD-dependent oxidoreductase n=1 Tax=Kribbella sp. VKM Ac-2569 TaxID=2512220 RepID=UPI00102B1247|nr:NAD(P)/FAD-dependent oxidoreductase [Kribbella sp. VKM Ac-2569]RZT27731.1 geranylgeranyl reductase family protein [Kribbella sp. VKM Ac-2569]
MWDVIVVGAGPAGASAAIGALAADPSLSVLLLDRHEFPRDKACGDGIAPHVLDLLAGVGVTGILDDWTPVRRFVLNRGDVGVDRQMSRPTWVVPRTVFDQRLVEAARAAGAQFIRRRVRDLEIQNRSVTVDEDLDARFLVGADGAHSVVRQELGLKPGPVALAIRGYAPTPAARAASQVIAYGPGRQPSYAWSFDRGDGWSNVGYGELLAGTRPTRTELLNHLEALLPGATEGGESWWGHHLPLAGWSWRPRSGPVLLAGDAAGLINPMTGEGIYYAVATGLLAGRAIADALRAGTSDAGTPYRRRTTRLLARHLRDTALVAQLSRSSRILDGGIRAAAADQHVFDDLVELGLADGGLTRRLLRTLLR